MPLLPHDLARSRDVQPIENVGLVLSRLAPMPPRSGDSDEVKRSYGSWLRQLAESAEPPLYRDVFRRWQQRTLAGPPTRQVLRVQAQTSVAIGLGEPTPGENGLSLHPVCGTPFLLGSSLKGVTRAWCRLRLANDPAWSPDGLAFKTLFGSPGDDGAAGAVDFLDALAEPGDNSWVAEILTPHHKSYYEGAGKVPPTGFEGPVPVVFLAVRGTFRVVLEGPPEWLKAAEEMLRRALVDIGVGAKTRAGYGRLVPLDMLDKEDQRALDSREKADFPGWPPEKQLPWLDRHHGTAAVDQSLLQWAQEDIPQLEMVRLLRRDEPTEAAVVQRLATPDRLSRWEKRLGDSSDKAAQARAWLERAARHLAYQPPWERTEIKASPTPQPPASPAGFGSNILTDLPKLPPNEKKKDKVLQSFADQVRRGAYDEPSVRRALAFLEENGSPPGRLNGIRRAYGIEES